MDQTVKHIVVFFIGILFANAMGAQLYINEVMPKNGSFVYDEDDDTPDWIEIFNASSSPVNLQNYGLSNTIDDIAIWKFPPVTIDGNGYLTVFASGKDRMASIDHWETAVKAQDNWRYIVPSGPVPMNWIQPTFNDNAWLQGPGGIGYGDGDDNTDIGGPAISVYMRRTFTITDTSKLEKVIFHMDCDDAFVAYINGYEIGRYNIGVEGFQPAWNDTAYDNWEARFYQMGTQDAFFEFTYDKQQFAGVFVPGNNVLAVEVHNISPTSSDLTALPFLHFGLSDAASQFSSPPAWFIPPATWMHTNFTLSPGGSVYLSDTSEALISTLTYPTMQPDHSFGPQPDGTGTPVLFEAPTPDQTNASQGFSGYTTDPVFSLAPGFYSGTQTVGITDTSTGSTIFYSLDGRDPDLNSPFYPGPVTIDSTRVLKARAYAPGLLPSSVVTASYFIDDTISSTLPVVSLSADPYSLFDWNEGIYVKGPNAQPNVPYFNANFWQSWEIPVSFEYYDKQRTRQVDQRVGAKIFGNWSRSIPQKSFKLIARGQYDAPRLDYQFFKDKDIHSFNQIVLRNGGNDWNGGHFRDAFCQNVAAHGLNTDFQAYQPCVVFLNGNFWGVYNIREKINADMIADNYNIPSEDVDLLEYNGSVMAGTNTDFNNMASFIIYSDMTIPANYASAAGWLDLKNATDYFAVETWSNNWDWLTNNVRYWRNNKTSSKWRYILWDLDLGLGATWPLNANGLDTNLNKPWDYHSLMMQSLLKNDYYRHYFINRYADLLNTNLSPSNLLPALNAYRDTIDPEMPRQFATWGWPFNNPDWGDAGRGTYNDWINWELPNIANFITYRQQIARDQIEQEFGLKKQVPITLNVSPPGAGTIHLNTIDIDTFPWAGIYFDSVPVVMTAIPNPGYSFAFWQSNIFVPTPYSTDSMRIHLDTGDVFTAYFFGSAQTPMLRISEVNYNSNYTWDSGDWVELYNPGTTAFDISGWRLKDSTNANTFLFPSGTVLQPGAYLVVCQDTALFSQHYPNVNNVIGPFVFNLKKTGERIRLLDDCLAEYTHVTYSNLPPWPTGPDGQGYTLENLDPNADPDDPANWFQGCPGGSPGGPFVACTTGQPDTQSESGISIVPNPAVSYSTLIVNMDQTQDLNYRLLTANGQQLRNVTIPGLCKGLHKLFIDLDNLSPGLYLIQVVTGAENRIAKLLIQ